MRWWLACMTTESRSWTSRTTGAGSLSSVFDDTDGLDALGRCSGCCRYGSGGRVYALVAGMHDDGVQIMDITNHGSRFPYRASLTIRTGLTR